MKNVAGQPCSTARTQTSANAGGVQPGGRGKMGKAFHTACRAQSEMKSLYAHIQISVYHQTRIFPVVHLSSKVAFLLAKS